MAATIETSAGVVAVKMRNLSAEGALIEGDGLPVEGTAVLFRRGELAVSGHFAWVQGNRGGIAFDEGLSPEDVLRNVPTPKPRTVSIYRRPGFAARQLTPGERKIAADYIFRPVGSDRHGE